MANQTVFDAKIRSKRSTSDPVPPTRVPYASHLKKAVRSVEEELSLCSAFLAERGCLGPGKSRKHSVA